MRLVRTVGPVGCLAVALALGGLAPVGVDSVAAARPVRGALYADLTADYTYRAYLGVSNSGRSLDPRRSRIVDPYCQGEPSIVRMGSRRHPVRVTRSGRFQLVQRVGRYVLRVRGLFTTKNNARIRFRYRREPARARPRSCENDTGRVALRPACIRPIPFSDCATHDAKTVPGDADRPRLLAAGLGSLRRLDEGGVRLPLLGEQALQVAPGRGRRFRP
jgi:hypothetical protein